MAKKKKKKNPIIRFLDPCCLFQDDRFRYALGIVFLLVALFMVLSMISYLVNWKTDQDFEWAKVFSGPDIRVENSGGKLGAWLSNLLINNWFGSGQLCIPGHFGDLGHGPVPDPPCQTGKEHQEQPDPDHPLFHYPGTFVRRCRWLAGKWTGRTAWLFSEQMAGGQHWHLGTIFLLIICYAALLLFSTPILEWIREHAHAFKFGPGTEKDAYPEETVSPQEDASPVEQGARQEASLEGEADPYVVNNLKSEEQADTPDEEKPALDPEAKDDVEMTIEDVSGNNPEDFNPDEGALGEYDPTLDLPKYQYPPLSLMKEYDQGDTTVTNEELISNKNRIVETLGNYNIKIDKIKATIGPTVTLYEIVPAPGIRISKIKSLEDDIALSLSALGIRIIAPIPGKGTIGIEVPNQNPRIVSMKSILSSKRFQDAEMELAIALGKTISNETFVFDLTKMPHLLVAGATGQGKSVGLNAIIASLLYKKHPAQLKFVMVDPKKVELSLYSKIERHFLAKLPESEEAIITDTQQVIHTLNSLCAEMDDRYNLLKSAQVRNIKEYNERFINRRLNPNKGHRYLPFIVVIIDEFADLIMTAGREIEHPISRLAQLARAIGIHLIIATQRPTTNIITGVIKANFPARIAFRVTSMIDSRTILDGSGADQLIGRGDMLFVSGSEPIRLQCAFVDGPEIEEVTDFIGQQRGYPTAMMLTPVEEDVGDGPEVDLDKRDDKFEEAARLVVQHQQGSTSLIQRKLSLGYNRAGRIVDQLEAAGILGPFEGSKARQVLVQDEFSLEQILNNLS
jgi:S-DNA-T family DNA segregation ATPase FtsK/SpoIIIE